MGPNCGFFLLPIAFVESSGLYAVNTTTFLGCHGCYALTIFIAASAMSFVLLFLFLLCFPLLALSPIAAGRCQAMRSLTAVRGVVLVER